jgi:hypothetical protein
MHDFLKPIFEFMEGNFVVFNIIILYGVPSLIGFCGLLCIFFANDFFDFVGRVLILLSAAACGVLAYYAFDLANSIIEFISGTKSSVVSIARNFPLSYPLYTTGKQKKIGFPIFRIRLVFPGRCSPIQCYSF